MSELAATPAPVSRRDFLRITAMAGGAALIGLGSTRVGSQRSAAVGVTRSAAVMGTLAHLTVFADSPRDAARLAEGALAEMSRLESLLTRHGSVSSIENVTRLNERRALAAPSTELRSVVAAALAWAQRSRGAFDPTVLPAVRLAPVADPGDALDRTRAAVDYRHVAVDREGVRLTNPDAALTLDSIGKGFIVDRTADLLRSQGLDSVLVEAGGDLAVVGVKPGRTDWTIGVRNPRSRGRLVSVDLGGRAVATSGDYENAFTDDFSRHHLVDPATCRPALKASSATVVAPDCMTADALSTAAFVLGPRDGVDFLESVSGAEGLIVDRAGRIARTRGFPGK